MCRSALSSVKYRLLLNTLQKTAIDVVVPEGAAESAVTVETVYGATKSVFHYRESRGLMFDFDGITGLGNHGWHNVPIETDADAPSGNYIMLGDGATLMAAEGPWNDGKFAFEYWPVTGVHLLIIRQTASVCSIL